MPLLWPFLCLICSNCTLLALGVPACLLLPPPCLCGPTIPCQPVSAFCSISLCPVPCTLPVTFSLSTCLLSYLPVHSSVSCSFLYLLPACILFCITYPPYLYFVPLEFCLHPPFSVPETGSLVIHTPGFCFVLLSFRGVGCIACWSTVRLGGKEKHNALKLFALDNIPLAAPLRFAICLLSPLLCSTKRYAVCYGYAFGPGDAACSI